MRLRILLVASQAAIVIGLLAAASPSSAAKGISDWLISTDFTSIQAAIDSLPAQGGVVYVPSGTHIQSRPIVFPTDRPVRLIGAALNATTLRWQTPSDPDADYVTIRGSHQSLENLTLEGTNNASHRARAVVVDPGTSILRGFQMTNVNVFEIPSWSVEALSSMGGTWVSILARIEGCHFSYNAGNSGTGLMKINQGCTTWSIRNCNFGANKNAMLELDRCGAIQAEASVFETNDDAQPFIKIFNCGSVALPECYFEASPAVQNQFFVKITGGINQAISMISCHFTRVSQTAARMVQCTTPDVVKSLMVTNPGIYLATDSSPTGPDIEVTDPASLVSVIGGSLGTNLNFFAPRINDGTDRSFLGNYNQRMRLPRVTTAERDALLDKKIGDLLYNTTLAKVQVWTGSNWSSL